MLLWVEPFMWHAVRVLGFLLELAGMAGLAVMAVAGLTQVCMWLGEIGD